MPRAGSSSSSDSPAAVAKAIRNGSWRIVTVKAAVRTTDSLVPTSKVAPGSPKLLRTTAYEWSRPRARPGAKRTRTISGARTLTATVPWALRKTSAAPSRRGAGIDPSDDHPARSGAPLKMRPRTAARTRSRRRAVGTGPPRLG